MLFPKCYYFESSSKNETYFFVSSYILFKYCCRRRRRSYLFPILVFSNNERVARPAFHPPVIFWQDIKSVHNRSCYYYYYCSQKLWLTQWSLFRSQCSISLLKKPKSPAELRNFHPATAVRPQQTQAKTLLGLWVSSSEKRCNIIFQLLDRGHTPAAKLRKDQKRPKPWTLSIYKQSRLNLLYTTGYTHKRSELVFVKLRFPSYKLKENFG